MVLRDSFSYPGAIRPKDIQHGEYLKDMLEDSLTGWTGKKNRFQTGRSWLLQRL
jgi:hypothetical protein